ncbi:MAG: hypothetical protein ABIC82_00615 [bacterium]
MKILRHELVQKDFKKLRRFPAPQDSLEAWERLFCLKGLRETPGIKMFSGFGDSKVYKARVIPLKERCGKSDGYRVIFKLKENDECEILVFSRHGVYNSEQELIAIIKERLNSL